MTATAKVFSTGNSQAVRLPKAFRVSAKEMWISKNELTGEITLKPVAGESSLDRLFRLIEEAPLPAEFLSEKSRLNDAPRNPFEIEKVSSRTRPALAVKKGKRA
jgi:antitoxin VapB